MQKGVQLQDYHEKNAHITDFAGFNLPLWFKGIIPESLAVRNNVGLFDVSHMGRAIIKGRDAQKFLDHLTSNDVASLKIGQGQYSLICNPEGGVKDDILVFHLKDDEYLIVYNAGNREKDFQWMLQNSTNSDLTIEDVSEKVAMFALQGPSARMVLRKLAAIDVTDIGRFGCAWTEVGGVRVLASRTGYTGEDGFELYVWDAPLKEPRKAEIVWSAILDIGKAQGLEPCGLGARDLLRLEAGLCLYGADMDESTNPFEARLNFVVKLQKGFIGGERLAEIKAKGTQKIRIGLLTSRKVIPRHGFQILEQGRRVGTVTSGTLSPILNTGIAMGYVEKEHSQDGRILEVQIRDRMETARIVKPPFYDTTKYGYSRKT